jgi:acetoin utilization deacetylase AcuC-like enzyme
MSILVGVTVTGRRVTHVDHDTFYVQDVHHGDGTQEQFLSNDNVLFFSVHRYDGGTFFPGSQDRPVTHGAAEEIGTGRGRHYNINIPWDTRGVSEKNFPGDSEYLDAFETVREWSMDGVIGHHRCQSTHVCVCVHAGTTRRARRI